ncbi:MAG: D-alanyl-D-alanine carboxypeptidase, partial [Cyanobacteria bacterium J06554_11]
MKTSHQLPVSPAVQSASGHVQFRPWKKLFLGLLGGLAVLTQANAAVAGICRADLPRKIDAIVNGYTLDGADVGILIEDANPDTRTLYARRAQEKFVPASNVKLLTTAAALHNLGPDFTIRTSVY